jgi:hypothetical protein
MESVSRKIAKITRPKNFFPLTNYSLLITTTKCVPENAMQAYKGEVQLH